VSLEAKGATSTKGPKEAAVDRAVDISRLDIRVGRIVSAEKHPNADSLYIEKIDVGEAEPRTVVSGLAKFMSLEELQDRLVVVLCNLKPVSMRGVKSEAMLLAAASDSKVEPLDPPSSCKPGDRVYVEGYEHEKLGAPDEILNPKKKIFEQIQPDLQTSAAHVATYKGIPLLTAEGDVRVNSLVSAIIR